MALSSDESLAISGRKILGRIFGSVYENELGWRLRHKEQLYELLEGPDNYGEIYQVQKVTRSYRPSG
jgi:hypothetical protein